MKKSSILLVIFLLVFLGGFVWLNWYALQQKRSGQFEFEESQALDTITHDVGTFKYLSCQGNWAIKIQQQEAQYINTVVWRESFDSVLVFVRNDTLFATNHETRWFDDRLLDVSPATIEITLPRQQQQLTIIPPFNSERALRVWNVQLDTLCIRSEFRLSEHNTECFAISQSNIKNLIADYNSVNVFLFSLKSDTIQNLTLKAKGVVNSCQANEDAFKHSLITNINLDCSGSGFLDLRRASNTPGKITGRIDGAINLGYPAEKECSELKINGMSSVDSYQQQVPSDPIIIQKEAFLNITSSPIFLPVFLDSAYVGRTPQRFLLQTGTHHLRIKSGPKTFDTTVTLKKGMNKGFDVDLR